MRGSQPGDGPSPSTARVTLREVAEKAGVHTSTVSRALSGSARELRIPVETEERIRRVAEELGYRGHGMARALRVGKSFTVGMIIPDIANLYVAGITRAAGDVLARLGYSLLLASTDDDLGQSRDQVSAMLRSEVDGVLYGVARRGDRALAYLMESGTPVVLINRDVDDQPVSAVVPDHAGGTTRAVEHLVGLGHRRILHIAGPQDVTTALLRSDAFETAISAAGVDGRSVFGVRHTEREGYRMTSQALEEDASLTAVVAANDRLAVGAIDAVRRAGRTCPEDMSVVGFNDMPYADHLHPPLTTIRVGQHDLGFRAARLLVDFIDDPDRAPVTEILPADLVVRGSTAPARAD